jgi:hypothetical protein
MTALMGPQRYLVWWEKYEGLKKSQALRMTALRGAEDIWLGVQKHEGIEKVTGSRDDNSVGVLTAIRLTTFEAYLCNRIVIPTGAYPDFLPSCTGQIRVCAFLLRKGA